MKYVVYKGKGTDNTALYGVIFTDSISHDSSKLNFLEPIGAGFCTFTGKIIERPLMQMGERVGMVKIPEIACWGHSQTLGIKSREELDSEVLHLSFYDKYVSTFKVDDILESLKKGSSELT